MKNPSNLVHLTLRKSQHRTSFKNTSMNPRHRQTLSRHASNCILLSWASLFPGTPWIASSSTACYFVALFSRYSFKLPTVLTLICFCLHSATILHQHGTYGQLGEESQFAEESRSTPWASTCTCIQGDSHLSLPIKCWNPTFMYSVRDS